MLKRQGFLRLSALDGGLLGARHGDPAQFENTGLRLP